MTNSTPALAGRRQWLGLAILGASSLLISIDVFVLLLAMPAISADLGASSTQQLWVLDVYGFLLAGFLVTMGSVGDRIGRRKLLLIGASAFTVASVVAAFSVSPLMLIVSRGALGIAGATLAPSTLALISNMFHNERQRGLAIGIWLMCFMGGAVIGPVVGGVLLEHFWWGSAFLIGVPVMVVVLILGPLVLPEFKDPDPGPLDPASVALSLAGILPLVYGIKQLAVDGVAAVPIAAMLIGIAFGVTFFRRQARLSHPLIDITLFRDASFSTAVGSMFLATVTGSMMFFITQYLQLVEGLPPLDAGLVSIPAVACAPLAFIGAPLLARRIRPGVLIPAGMAITLSGAVVVATIPGPDHVVQLIAGYALFQLGCGPLVTLSTGIVVGSAPPEKAGAAAAMSETSAEFGYSVGLAVLGTMATALYRSDLPSGFTGLTDGESSTVRESLAGAVEVGNGPALAAAREAFMSGFQLVAVTVGVLAVVIAVVNGWFHRDIPPMAPGETEPGAEPAVTV